MKKLQLLILFVALLFVAKAQNSSIFVEAESFTIKDGWAVDPQFIEQMGSPYLLAPGRFNILLNKKRLEKLLGNSRNRSFPLQKIPDQPTRCLPVSSQRIPRSHRISKIKRWIIT